MKRFLAASAAILLLTIMLAWGINWLANGGWPTTGASTQKLPVHIEFVQPLDGQRLTESYGFCAHFFYAAGSGMGDNPQDAVRFYLDGKNVTESVVDLARLEYGYPVPDGEPCYRQDAPLRPGWHTAKIRYTDITGERYSYTWHFEVLFQPDK